MRDMYDYHTHTLLSDGALIPAEQARHAQMAGYRILGISDHSDLALLPNQIATTVAAAHAENRSGSGLSILPGTELTHVRPNQIAEAAALARRLGAMYVIVHGETLVEPVQSGTNRAAIEAGVDILAHPGQISDDDAKLAAERGVRLEISAKRGHSLANGHVAKMAEKHGVALIFGSDTHAPGDMPTRDFAERVCLAAGLTPDQTAAVFAASQKFGETLLEKFNASAAK